MGYTGSVIETSIAPYRKLGEPTKTRVYPELRESPISMGLFLFFSFLPFFKGVASLSWRIVYISEAEEMKLYLDNLKVVKDEQEVLIPLSDIHTIVVDNDKTTITGRLMNKLTEYHILLIFCDETHNPNVFSLGLYSHYRVYGVLKQQLNWSDAIKGEMWRKIIQIKIHNQKTVLQYLEKDEEVIHRMERLAQSVEFDDERNNEGHAAKLYFSTLFGKPFHRQREAVDIINASLNYGYIVLRSCVARTIVAYGLHPAFGIGHRNQFNAFNLVDDCMEIFRPIIDLWVYLTSEESEYLDQEKKQQLVRRLSAKVLIGNQKQTVLNAIDLYVQSFIKAMNRQDISQLLYPSDGIAL